MNVNILDIEMTTLSEHVASTVATLMRQYRTCQILLIHPEDRYRTLILAALLQSQPCSLYYYALGVNDAGLEPFLRGLVIGLSVQVPAFGYQVNATLRETPENTELLAIALANDLAVIQDDDYILILDEYDRVDQNFEYLAFVDSLLTHLPEHCHLLLSTRTQPSLPWMALVAAHKALVLHSS